MNNKRTAKSNPESALRLPESQCKHQWEDIERLILRVDKDFCFRRPSVNMGSYPDTVNLLEHLRSRSQVDCDSLDLERELFNCLTQYPFRGLGTDIPIHVTVAKELGPFVDSTSNQVRG